MSIASFLLRQIKEAVLELEEKSRIHHEFSDGLPTEDVTAWTELLDAWEEDNSKLSPFGASLKGKYLEFVVEIMVLDMTNVTQRCPNSLSAASLQKKRRKP